MEAHQLTMKYIKTSDGQYWELGFDHTNDPDRVAVCNPGGGFIMLIPRSDVVDWDAQLPVNYRRVTVGFDGRAVCEAWVNFHQRWNGWLMPLVDGHNLQKVLLYLNEEYCLTGEGIRLWMDGPVLVVKWPEEETPERYEPQSLNVEGETVTVWDVSLGYTWEDIDEEDKDKKP